MKRIFSLLSVLMFSLLVANPAFALLPKQFGKLDIDGAIAKLPQTSDKAFVDIRLVDNGDVGVRVFRIYKPVYRHHHAFSSTYLIVQSGKAQFGISDEPPVEVGVGDMVFWQANVDHELIKIIEHPLTFIAIDTPTRRLDDVFFRPTQKKQQGKE